MLHVRPFILLLVVSFSLFARHIWADVVEIKLKRDVVRFNAAALVPRLEGAPVLDPIGPIKVIPLDDQVRFFPIIFHVWTRHNRLMTQTHPRLLHHTCHLSGVPGPVERHYEFNLTQLASPLNPWRPSRRTVVIVPGYKTGHHEDWMDEMSQLWLELEDVNVVQVYWPEGNSGSYNKAVTSTKIVARQIAMFLYYLSQLHGVDFKSSEFGHTLQIVGHSLGAHIAGFVGQELSSRVGRITGLDPAGPNFEDIDQRLDPTDAHLVDAIHTNVGKMNVNEIYLTVIGSRISKVTHWLNPFNWFRGGDSSGQSLAQRYERKSKEAQGWFGLPAFVGHLDYFANDGSLQPGCDDDLHVCDHHRASLLYNGFLRYELAARQAHGGPDSETIRTKRHRLVALPSSDYGKLVSSRSLARNCPALLKSNLGTAKRVGAPNDKFSEIRRCAMPIDVTAPGAEFKQELELDYDLPLVQSISDEQQQQRLYFLTTNQEPYVAEQHLMQLHLSTEHPILWSKGCRLTTLVQSPSDDKLVSLVHYEPALLEPLEGSQLRTSSIVLPFASPVDWLHYGTTPATISKLLEQANAPNSTTTQMELLENFLPGLLAIELTHFSGTKKQIKCQLHIDFIETRPFTFLDYNISLWYGRQAQESVEDSFHLELTNTRPYDTLKPVLVSTD